MHLGGLQDRGSWHSETRIINKGCLHTTMADGSAILIDVSDLSSCSHNILSQDVMVKGVPALMQPFSQGPSRGL